MWAFHTIQPSSLFLGTSRERCIDEISVLLGLAVSVRCALSIGDSCHRFVTSDRGSSHVGGSHDRQHWCDQLVWTCTWSDDHHLMRNCLMQTDRTSDRHGSRVASHCGRGGDDGVCNLMKDSHTHTHTHTRARARARARDAWSVSK